MIEKNHFSHFFKSKNVQKLDDLRFFCVVRERKLHILGGFELLMTQNMTYEDIAMSVMLLQQEFSLFCDILET